MFNKNTKRKKIFKKYIDKQSKSSNELYELNAPNKDVSYVVQKDDTLSGITNKFDASLYYLVQKNEIKNQNLIFTGEIIRI